MSYKQIVKVQVKRIEDGGKVLYSNPDPISFKMEQSGYLEIHAYEGDNLLFTQDKWINVGETRDFPTGVTLSEGSI